MPSSRSPSQRQLRAGELVRHALAAVFTRGEVGDPLLEKIGVSVLELEMSPDLKFATAYVRPLQQGQGDMLLKLLDKHRRYIRGLVTPHVAVKFMPEIRFRLDTSADYADKIDRLLRDPMVARDLSPKSEEK